MIKLPIGSNIDLKSFERILDEKLSSSYKLFWFLGIYKEIILGKKEITFIEIIHKMISSAWYCVTEYKLNLGYLDQLFDTIIFIQKKYNLKSDINEKELLLFLKNTHDIEIEKRIKGLCDYVPYRLLTPFYSEEINKNRHIFGKNDTLRNRFIVELSNLDPKGIYKIDAQDRKIIINMEWYNYIYINQNIILAWINYKIICYLQKRNPNVPAIPFKINPPIKRNLTKAKNIWTLVSQDRVIKDIYSEKELLKSNFEIYGDISIDHFIPWSFVLHDELWNLIPTFKNINSSKSNKLPDLNLYLEKFAQYQYYIFKLMQKNYKKHRTTLEDYLSINIDGKAPISENEFKYNLQSTIKPLYQIAENQGYEKWYKIN